MKKFWKWLPAMLACALAGNHAAAATFESARDDFRDESIYFVMTTRFRSEEHTSELQSQR